jgi:hypothetical protein
MEVCGLLRASAALPHGTDWIGGWVGPTAGLDMVEKRKIPATGGNRNPVVQPVVHSLNWLSYIGS